MMNDEIIELRRQIAKLQKDVSRLQSLDENRLMRIQRLELERITIDEFHEYKRHQYLLLRDSFDRIADKLGIPRSDLL